MLKDPGTYLLDLTGSTMDSDDCSIGDFKQVVFPCVYLLVFILGVVGHSVSLYVIFSVWRKKRRLTTVNLFMINLLLSDFMLVCSLPFRAAYFLRGSDWPFGRVSCSLLFYVFYLNINTSIFFLMSLVIIRYLALVHPLRFMSFQKYCNWWVVCVIIWLFTALICVPLLELRSDRNNETSKCMELPKNQNKIDSLLKMSYAALALFILPLTVILSCSVLIAYKLLRPGVSQRKVSTSRKRAFALIIISLISFLVCFFPYHVDRLVFLHAEFSFNASSASAADPSSCRYMQVVRKSAVVTLCLCTMHSCLDPILLFFVGENFRSFLTRLLWREKTGGRIQSWRQVELRNPDGKKTTGTLATQSVFILSALFKNKRTDEAQNK